MAYIINVQDCFTSRVTRDVARVRNRLFTAITRSKAWVRVLGVGLDMAELKAEFKKAKAAGVELRFGYPTEAERNQMTMVIAICRELNRRWSKKSETACSTFSNRSNREKLLSRITLRM
jgi:superfamily I DNA and RNA helicase